MTWRRCSAWATRWAPSVTHSIWQATSIAALNRLMKHPEFAPRYFWHLKNLIDTTFSANQFDPFLDHLLGDWVPPATVAQMKKFIADRNRLCPLRHSAEDHGDQCTGFTGRLSLRDDQLGVAHRPSQRHRHPRG